MERCSVVIKAIYPLSCWPSDPSLHRLNSLFSQLLPLLWAAPLSYPSESACCHKTDGKIIFIQFGSTLLASFEMKTKIKNAARIPSVLCFPCVTVCFSHKGNSGETLALSENPENWGSCTSHSHFYSKSPTFKYSYSLLCKSGVHGFHQNVAFEVFLRHIIQIQKWNANISRV